MLESSQVMSSLYQCAVVSVPTHSGRSSLSTSALLCQCQHTQVGPLSLSTNVLLCQCQHTQVGPLSLPVHCCVSANTLR